MRKIKLIKASLVVSIILIVQAIGMATPVEQYGQLTISGNQMVGANGDAVQLRGMSFFWSQWYGQFYTSNVVEWLRDDWKCSVVRAALGVYGTESGYLVNPNAEKAKVQAVVDAAINLGIYVVIDWHSHHALDEQDEAIAFFSEMAQMYGDYPNVIYEIFNEPLQVSWNNELKPYHEAVIAAIRAHDPDNIIVCGTSTWSQDVDDAAANPITAYDNIAYTLHYYADTHTQWLRDRAAAAINSGIALFVTEFGTCDASGGDPVNATESELWFDFMDEYMISWCNWSVADKDEAASALLEGASTNGGWSTDQISVSGTIVRNKLIERYLQDTPDDTAPPAISSQPEASVVAAGSSYQLEVNVVSVETPQYQWYFEGNPIAGATESIFVINNFDDSDAGTYYVAITNSNGTTNSDEVILGIVNRSVFADTIVIPGVIEAENFDIGGNGITYYDNTAGNAAVDAGNPEYRVGDCDIETSEDGGYQLGWVANGEWTEYTVQIDTAGDYLINAYAASDGGSGVVNVSFGDYANANINVSSTGSWQTREIFTGEVTLQTGVQVVRVEFNNIAAGINLDKLELICLSVDTADNPIDTTENPIDTVDNPIDTIDNSVDTVDNPIDTTENPIDTVGGTDENTVVNRISSSEIRVYPTVTNDFITIEVDQISSFEIYSVYSKADEIEINTKTLYSVSDLTPGMYIVKVSNSDGMLIERILVK